MSMLAILELCASGLLMGIVAVSLGGGAIVGIPLVSSLGYPINTSVIAVTFGLMTSFFTGTVAYRRVAQPAVELPFYIWPLSALGCIFGANLFLKIDPNLLRVIVLFLLIFVFMLSLIFKPSKIREEMAVSSLRKTLGSIVIILLCTYSGFFGAGFGTFLIFTTMYFYGYSFLESAAISTKVALLTCGISLVTFFFKGAINFSIAIPIAIGCAVGGFVGANLAQKVGDKLIRNAFFAITVTCILKLGYEVFH